MNSVIAEQKTVREVFEEYVLAKTAMGVAEVTVRNYRQHFASVAKYLDLDLPIGELSRELLDAAVADMRESGLAYNSVATYVRSLKSFLSWCDTMDIVHVSFHGLQEHETVKDTYSDAELGALLKRPNRKSGFCEYRNWVIINFLVNSGCRAATVRNIQNRDVDIEGKRVVFRHNKNRKIQIIPLCTEMCAILREYMKVRKGADTDYLFCNQYGEMLTRDGLCQAIAKYNKARGVEKTSIHMFRHTFARKYLIDCGGNAFTLQKLLGHSTLEMTKRYCAIFDADIAKGFDSVSPLSQLRAREHSQKISR